MTELEKLQEIFQKVDPDKQRLVEKLLHDAAFLSGQNEDLRKMIEVTGMVKFHPTKTNRSSKAIFKKSTNVFSRH